MYDHPEIRLFRYRCPWRIGCSSAFHLFLDIRHGFFIYRYLIFFPYSAPVSKYRRLSLFFYRFLFHGHIDVTAAQVISHADIGLANVERAALAGLAILDTASVVADEGLLRGHVGLFGDEHPVVVLEVVVDLSPGEHVVGNFQVF